MKRSDSFRRPGEQHSHGSKMDRRRASTLRSAFLGLAASACAATLALSPWSAAAATTSRLPGGIPHYPSGRTWALAKVPRRQLQAAHRLFAAVASPRSIQSGSGRRPRIVGGSGAVQGQWGFMAFVLYYDSSGNPEFICSGTVVSSNVVLTAGHCGVDESTDQPLDPSGYRVVTGAVDWTDTTERQVSDVSQVLVDPNFDSVTLDHDAALLVLSAPVSAPAIPLWASGELAGGTGALIAGWGDAYYGDTNLQTLLQWAPTVVQNTSYCAQRAPANYDYDSSAELCAIDAPTDDAGTCNGDSGGPLLADDTSGTLIEIGITSVGPTDCDTESPDYFTALLPLESWAESAISAAASAPAAPPSTTTTTQPPATTTPPTTTPPNPTPATLPTMSKATARSYVHQVLLGVFHGVFERRYAYEISCSRVSADRMNCGTTFSSGPNDYYGTVTVFYEFGGDGKLYWTDKYTIRWVNDYCYFHSGHRRTCNIKAKRGTF